MFEMQIFLHIVWELFDLLMLRSILSADFQRSVCVEFHFNQAVVCNPTNFTKQNPSQMLLQLSQKLPQICVGRASLRAFLAGTSRLLLTCYKTNQSQPKDGSRNLATLKKDVFVTVVNEKLKNVYSCLKTLCGKVPGFVFETE